MAPSQNNRVRWGAARFHITPVRGGTEVWIVDLAADVVHVHRGPDQASQPRVVAVM